MLTYVLLLSVFNSIISMDFDFLILEPSWTVTEDSRVAEQYMSSADLFRDFTLGRLLGWAKQVGSQQIS